MLATVQDWHPRHQNEAVVGIAEVQLTELQHDHTLIRYRCLKMISLPMGSRGFASGGSIGKSSVFRDLCVSDHDLHHIAHSDFIHPGKLIQQPTVRSTTESIHYC